MRVVRWFVAGVVIAVVMVVAIGVWIDRSTPVQVIVSALPPREVHVQVDGAVALPGVVILSGEPRLLDVIDAAGGMTEEADLSALNLAGRVGDGERVTIPARGGAEAADASAPASTAARLNLNAATAAELEALPGIGAVLADRIIELREQKGGFSSIDELVEVKGISHRLLEDLRPLVIVDEGG